MPQLTSAALTFLTGVNCLILALWFLVLWWRAKSESSGRLSWAAGLALHGLGWISIVLRGSGAGLGWLLPGALLMLPGTLLLLDGFYRLLAGRAVPRYHLIVLLIFEALLLYFTYGRYHTPLRGILASAYHTYIILWMALVLPGNSDAVSGGVRVGLRLVLTLLGGALALRMFANIVSAGNPHYASLTNAPLDLFTALAFFSTGFMPSLIFLAISNEANERRRQSALGRLDDLVASVDGIVWEADARTVTFTYVSSKAERLLGYPTTDWLQPGFWQAHIYKDDQIWAPKFCAERALTLEPHEFEYRFVAKDGRIVWLRDLVTVVAEKGRPRWLRGVMVDVTARKKDEAELNQLKFVHEMLSQCRKAFAESLEAGPLLERIVAACTISDDMLLAWIGEEVPGTTAVTNRAAAGKAIKYLGELRVSTDSTAPEGRGPTGRAMRDKRSVFVSHLDITSRDIFTESRLAYGMHSCASVYFLNSNGRAMSLNLYAAPGDFFSAQIIEFFEQLGVEISLALERLAIERWRTHAEQNIRESQILLDFAIESTVDAVWDYDPRSDTVKFSHHWEAMLGYDKGELKNSLVDWERLIHPQDLNTMNDKLQGYLRGEVEAFDITLRMQNKQGEYIWVKDRGVIVERDATGSASRLVGTLKNIDSEVRSREEARRNAIILDEVFNAAPVGLLVIDKNNHVVRSNPKVSELAGIKGGSGTEVSPIDTTFFDEEETAYPSGSLPRVIGNLRSDDAVVQTFGVRTRENAAIRWVHAICRYVPAIDSAICVTSDITDLVASQKSVRSLAQVLEERVKDRTQELEEINRELEAFSYSLSHDLKAPLVRAESWLNILQQKLRGTLDDNAEGVLQYVRRELAAMTSMSDAMMQLARVSQTEIIATNVDLSQMAEQILEDLRLESPDAVIQAEIQPKLTALADAGLVRVLLRNLLENAVKYSRVRPVVKIEFGQSLNEGVPTYFVRDNGIGFDMQYADRLFAPFQRLHSEKEYPGNGIGLATAQRIVHRHGGTISAESAVDAGTSIFFSLRKKALSEGDK